MKVAFTSKTGEMIDQHFGMSDSFRVWEIGPDEARYVETLTVGNHGDDEEDRIGARADVLKECVIVYTMQIGGPAAAKLLSRKIQPMKTGTEVAVAEIVGKLQEVLKGNPPPWLRKAMRSEKAASFLDD
jgi:nitrogen fixation protein NifX